ncbi:MAG: DUF433 domain-containing protein [Deltaproteobacteria bacterium]|nr:DUF433 domain-containing protein [Deltaproteobacteria bacterium]
MTREQLESQLASLRPAERAQLLQQLVGALVDAWPGIEKDPLVAGGEACVVRTRIPVWCLARFRRLGWSEARILENYPTLRAADLVSAWAYTDAHPDEIDRAVRDNEEA